MLYLNEVNYNPTTKLSVANELASRTHTEMIITSNPSQVRIFMLSTVNILQSIIIVVVVIKKNWLLKY
jgi:hypothetical protein